MLQEEVMEVTRNRLVWASILKSCQGNPDPEKQRKMSRLEDVIKEVMNT